MPRLNAGDNRRIAEVCDLLCRIELTGHDNDSWMEPFKDLLRVDQFMLYALAPRDDFFELTRFDALGWPAGAKQAASAFLGAVRTDCLYFDPMRPAAWQRNRAFTEVQLSARTRMPLPAGPQLAKRILTPKTEQVRVLVCDGPALVAWVGGLRDGTFRPRDAQVLSAIAPILCRRLVLEQSIAASVPYREMLGAVLEAVGAQAFVLTESGAVVHCNSAGQVCLDINRAETVEALRSILKAALRGRQFAGATATRVGRYWLVVDRRAPARNLEARLAAWARSLDLTKRQREVATLLVQGASNASIAAVLGCAERTVEVHVSAILAKAGAESRAEIIARLVSS
ncbi:MAG: LuxR C-terminal-related transcriptional regulator [Polyangiaceae bacterium]